MLYRIYAILCKMINSMKFLNYKLFVYILKHKCIVMENYSRVIHSINSNMLSKDLFGHFY